MNLASGNATVFQRSTKFRPIRHGFRNQGQTRRFEPGFHLSDRRGKRRRRRIDPGVGDNREKLMNAWPGNCPCRPAFGKFRQLLRRSIMPRRVFSMSVNQDIRIYRNYPPRRSYTISRICSQLPSFKPACSPLPLKLALRSLNKPRFFRCAMTCLNPCSTYARIVVPSFAASLFASSRSESDISMVVFIQLYVSIWTVICQVTPLSLDPVAKPNRNSLHS